MKKQTYRYHIINTNINKQMDYWDMLYETGKVILDTIRDIPSDMIVGTSNIITETVKDIPIELIASCSEVTQTMSRMDIKVDIKLDSYMMGNYNKMMWDMYGSAV